MSNYYYKLNATNNGKTTSVTGLTSPLQLVGLSNETVYTVYVDSYLDGILEATTPSVTVNTETAVYISFTTIIVVYQ